MCLFLDEILVALKPDWLLTKPSEYWLSLSTVQVLRVALSQDHDISQ